MTTQAKHIGSKVHSFSEYPSERISRSKFVRNNENYLTMNAGYLVPIWHDIAYPGDTLMIKTSAFARLATQIVPFMNDLYMDIHFWCVPHRLIWEHWVNMNGEQSNPGDSTDYLTPQLTTDSTTSEVIEQTIFDYFDIPINVPNLSFNAFNFRAYNLVWNEWYRDENLQTRVTQSVGDSGDDSMSDYTLLKRGKRKDYFTSALPTPQKGPGVELPLGTIAPVVGTNQPLGLRQLNIDGTPGTTTGFVASIDPSGSHTCLAPYTYTSPNTNIRTSGAWTVSPDASLSGLVADLSQATAATINSLRQAFAIQRMYEKDNIGGTRYIEMILAHFGVKSPDARLQRPEFLGGCTLSSDTTVVPQTSGTTNTSPQANLAAFSTISGVSGNIVHSFTEHCVVFAVASIRTDLIYQQGLPREYTYRNRTDFYLPTLAHLGEQAILNKEIYAQGDNVVDAQSNVIDDKVFGYQERFAEMRYKPDRIHGYLRSTSSTSLDYWHLAQEFSSLPQLNYEFIEENPPIDRVLAVSGDDVPQFICNFFFKETWIRPLPVYSIPGLSSHF